MEITLEIRKLAEILYEFHRIDMDVEICDIILVPCSHDLRVADYASELFLWWYWSKIIFSWWIVHQKDLLSPWWDKTEAEIFGDRAIELWVPSNNIIYEKEATNTGENINKIMKLIKENNISCDKILLVQKPYMQQRTFLTFVKQYPLAYSKIIVTWPQISFENYPNDDINIQTLINILVGDIQRLIVYPKLWYQDYIEIPPTVMKAFEELKEKWFTQHLIKTT